MYEEIIEMLDREADGSDSLEVLKEDWFLGYSSFSISTFSLTAAAVVADIISGIYAASQYCWWYWIWSWLFYSRKLE